MDEYAGFWWGRGLVGQPALPPTPPQPRGGHEHVERDRPSWIERCRAWVALVGDLVGLLFRLLALAAFAWCMWQGLAVVADGREALQTGEGARRAGRTVDAFLSSLSAPALAVLGTGLTVLVVTVVFVLRGKGAARGCKRQLQGRRRQPRHLTPSQQGLLGAQLGVGLATLGVAPTPGGGGRSSQGVSQTPGFSLSQEHGAGGSSWRTTSKRWLWLNPGGGGWGGTTP